MLQKYSLGSLTDYSPGRGSTFCTPPGEPASRKAQGTCQFSLQNASGLVLRCFPSFPAELYDACGCPGHALNGTFVVCAGK